MTMKHDYRVTGMRSEHERLLVEERLNSFKGVKATVTLEPAQATIEMDNHVNTDVFAKALSDLGDYRIEMVISKPAHHPQPHEHTQEHQPKAHSPTACCGQHSTKAPSPQMPSGGKFYCPMFCEGDKVYEQAGDCPICGMSLVQAPIRKVSRYTCPMHPEIIREVPGDCPICGMDLVPMEPISAEENATYLDLLRRFRLALLFTLPIFILAMGEMVFPSINAFIPKTISNWIQFALSLPVIYAAGIFYERGWRSLKTRKFNMFTLVAIGTGAALLFSVFVLLFPTVFPADFRDETGNVHVYFEAVVVILTLVLLGQLLEASAHGKTNQALQALMKLAPTLVTRITAEGKEEEIDIQAVNVGDRLRVKPGGSIPVDGKIDSGAAAIDESMLSGEPIPVDKTIGDTVSSGTINGNTTFTMLAQRVGDETLLSQIITMVENASRSRAPIQRLVDKISEIFVPIVILVAALTFIIWFVWGPTPAFIFAMSNAVAVLIISCPCALGLATPLSIMVGVGNGAQNGILIKEAEALERFNQIDTLIIDKTGTITEGKPSVEHVFAFTPFNEQQVINLATSINQHSEHPLATATVNYGRTHNATRYEIAAFSAVTGKGVTGEIEGQRIGLGNRALMEQLQCEITPEMETQVIHEQNLGKTVSYLSIDDQIAGFVVITDKIKATSRAALATLMSEGVDVIMLTGDNHRTAKAVAQQLGLTDFGAELLPDGKMHRIEALQKAGNIVAMAGDGINDAPALAQADIGIAMGTGTDVAIESAEITLIKGDLMGIVRAKHLSHYTMVNIRQNLFFAFVYNALGIPIAAGILYPFVGILLSPMIAAAAMAASSLCVITNALRLRNKRLD